MDPASGVDIYQKFGTAALFIVMYLATVFMFIKSLQKQVDDGMRTTERVTAALEANKIVMAELSDTSKELKDSTDRQARQSENLLNYLRGRDGKGQLP